MWCHLLITLALLICPLSTGPTNTEQDRANDLLRYFRDYITEGGQYADLTEARNWLRAYNDVFQKKTQEMTLASWQYETDVTPQNAARKEDKEIELSEWLDEQYEEAKKFARYKSLLCTHGAKCKDTLRMLDLIIKTMPSGAPPDKEDAKKLASVKTQMQTIFASSTIKNGSIEFRLDPELSEILATSRDYDKLLWAWKSWHDTVGPQLKPLYEIYVNLSNVGAQYRGFSDLGESWRVQNYEHDNIEEIVDDLWKTLKPIYVQLHAYVRRKLRERYPGHNIGKTIPAHILGDMWAQQWMNIIDLVQPYPEVSSYDVTQEMVSQNYDPHRIFKTAEEFFTSLGLEPMTAKFWERSMITRPQNRTVECHASAEDFFTGDDFRIKMCTTVTMDNLQTVHHEMGHIEYYMQYRNQPPIYRDGANAAFHEAVGDTIALSVMTPAHLETIGLLKEEDKGDDPTEDHKRDINFLMKMALEKIAFLPFALVVEKWRWGVFRGEITPDNYNEKWWQLRKEYQGVTPPVARDDNYFDAGCKYHVPANVPYIRYFLSFVGQFQFHRALCDAKGHVMELHKCDIYRSKDAGDKLMSMLSLGRSVPWEDAMFTMTGQRSFDASAIVDYFRNLQTWLQAENDQAQQPADVPGWS